MGDGDAGTGARRRDAQEGGGVTTEVRASAETLMRQASMTAEEYLHRAIKCINAAFGDDTYADQHPELVASFMNVCAQDFHSAMVKASAQDIRDALSDSAQTLRDALQEIRDEVAG
jgi:hypothetical protein